MILSALAGKHSGALFVHLSSRRRSRVWIHVRTIQRCKDINLIGV